MVYLQTLKRYIKEVKIKKRQYWEREELPKDLSRITSIFQWNDRPSGFKNKWVDYIEAEFDRRELGYWFYNNGKANIYDRFSLYVSAVDKY